MSSPIEMAERSYDRACGLMHSIAHRPSALSVTRELIENLVVDYSIAKGLVDYVTSDDGSINHEVVHADFLCGTIQEAAMAAFACGAHSGQKGRRRTVTSAGFDADGMRDCLVTSFGVQPSRADAFVNLLEMATAGGALEPALRGSTRDPEKFLGILRDLTRPRGVFDFREIFAEADGKAKAASA